MSEPCLSLKHILSVKDCCKLTSTRTRATSRRVHLSVLGCNFTNWSVTFARKVSPLKEKILLGTPFRSTHNGIAMRSGRTWAHSGFLSLMECQWCANIFFFSGFYSRIVFVCAYVNIVLIMYSLFKLEYLKCQKKKIVVKMSSIYSSKLLKLCYRKQQLSLNEINNNQII